MERALNAGMTKTLIVAAGVAASMTLAVSGCATLQSIFAPGPDNRTNTPIRDPFGDPPAAGEPGSPESDGGAMIFRSRRPDGSVELEVPRGAAGVTDFVLPSSSLPAGALQRPASSPGGDGPGKDESYLNHPPTLADREITHEFSQGAPEDQRTRSRIERGLGLMATDDATPDRSRSYLGALDHIRQLYHATRYEAALIETDALIRDYPTAPRLYEMRGTLLDRLGHEELALRSWNQALRFDPGNASLRAFIERRQARMPAGAIPDYQPTPAPIFTTSATAPSPVPSPTSTAALAAPVATPTGAGGDP